MNKFPIILLLLSFFCCKAKETRDINSATAKASFDSHVHIMSPDLISYWKSLGIPFSQTDAIYANIDTIMEKNNADYVNLIGMGYVFTSHEYYEGEDRQEKMQSENNYLFESAQKYPKRITPYFAIDPLQDFAVEEMERCYGMFSKCGVKLHFNASQVYLTEPVHLEKVTRVFKKSAEYDLPILLHFDNWHPKFGKRDLGIMMDTLLKDIPPVTLQIAHFGTSGGFNEKTKAFIDAYLELKNDDRIPEGHEIIFDISAVALDKDSEGVEALTDEGFETLKVYIDKIGIENIVFGTDYPLYTSDDYYKILKENVGLSEKELDQIYRVQ